MHEEREKLLEAMGVYLENTYQLPPLASRIYALLMLCPRSGRSFDDVVELSQSSKSSVSTNLNLLISRGNIEYFTKPGERKRYFRLSKNHLKISLERNRDAAAQELGLIHQINEYNKKYHQDKYEKHKTFGQIYMDYLESHYKNLENVINKMNKLEKQFI